MEWKIGEIKQVNGEWYQCVEGTGCYQCAFNDEDNACQADNPHCLCRSDKKKVVFKKLEKVGEPIIYMDRTFQRLKSFDTKQCKYCYFRNQVCNPQLCGKESFLVEIKQNKEDMEEYKMHDAKEDIPEFDKVVDECLFGEDKPNLKSFDLEAAKAGKPVCTRDGRKARIICFDKQEGLPIVALVERNKNGRISEEIALFYINGRAISADIDSKDDLMMLPEKKKDIPEFDKVVDECLFGKNKLKPFNIQKAKSGKPVCTRDGRKARIICFDRMDIKPVVALVTVVNDTSVTEKALYYFEDGHHLSKNDDNINDLMMLPEKKEGWINVYDTDTTYRFVEGMVYNTKDEAIQRAKEEITNGQREKNEYVDTVKMSWEE